MNGCEARGRYEKRGGGGGGAVRFRPDPNAWGGEGVLSVLGLIRKVGGGLLAVR